MKTCMRHVTFEESDVQKHKFKGCRTLSRMNNMNIACLVRFLQLILCWMCPIGSVKQ
jgi:hypothetical protein